MPSASGRGSQAPWNNPTTVTVPTGAPSLVVKTRVLDGALTGIASAAIAGGIWWAIATFANLEQWHLGAALVGLIVGQGVLIGSRKGGLVSGLLALVFSTLTVIVAVYFIDRSQTVIALADAGRSSDIPLWQGFGGLEDVYRGWWEFDKTRPAMWLLAPLIAVAIAGWPGRRPVVG